MNEYIAKSQLHIPYCIITSSFGFCAFISHFHFTTYESECHPFCMLTCSSSYVFLSTLVLIYIRAIWTQGTAAPYDRNWLFLLSIMICAILYEMVLHAHVILRWLGGQVCFSRSTCICDFIHMRFYLLSSLFWFVGYSRKQHPKRAWNTANSRCYSQDSIFKS
jgi:hypothetical protein